LASESLTSEYYPMILRAAALAVLFHHPAIRLSLRTLWANPEESFVFDQLLLGVLNLRARGIAK